MKKTTNSRLLPPKLKENRLVREALQAKITLGFDKKIMVLEAGAGHGKSVALRAALEHLPKDRWRWINLSKDSDQSLSFWSFVLDSLEDFLGREKDAVFEYFNLITKENEMSEFIYLLANVLYGEELYLVLEDFHNIESETILKSLELFMKSVSPSVHLIVTTRVKPSIYLGEFLMKDQLHYISEEDFLLDNQSAKEFINLSKSDLSLEVQNQLVEKASGWIGGLQLLLLSKEYSTPRSSQTKVMHDYLVSEIIGQFTSDEVCFLVQTAYYPFVFEELTRALFPEISHHEMLHKLLERNLMLTLFEGEGSRFTYHPLIRDSLIEEFMKLPLKKISSQKKTVATVLIEAGYFDEGIALLFELHEETAIMELIVAQQPQSLRSSYYISKISDSSAVMNVDFAIQKLLYYYISLDYEHGESLIYRIEASHPLVKESRILEVFRKTIFGNVRTATSLNINEAIMKELNLSDGSNSLIALVSAIYLFYNESIFAAIQSVKQSMRYNQVLRNPFMSYYSKTFLAQIYEEIGDVTTALAMLEETSITLKSWDMEDSMLLNYNANFNLTIAGIYLKKMELDQAKASLDIAVHLTHSHPHASYLYNEVERLYLEGDIDHADQVMKELNALAYYTDFKNKTPLIRYQLKNNHLSLRKQNEYIKEYETMDRLLLNDQILYGMLLLSRGRMAEARRIAEEILELSRKDKLFSKIISASLLKMDCMLKEEILDERSLADAYHEAIYYGKEHGLLSDFVLYKDMLRQLYKVLTHKLTSTFDIDELEFHDRVWKFIGDDQETLLSQRELEVLIELSQGYKNKEIADHLFISLATTKTHILNIYRKLEVNSRVMAIEEAKRLGLLI